MFNILKTRKEKLIEKIKNEILLSNENNELPNIEYIISCVEEFEKSNIDTINKLKRKKHSDIRKINGALKQTINAHGPITRELIGSASKRIYGALLKNNKKNIFKAILDWL